MKEKHIGAPFKNTDTNNGKAIKQRIKYFLTHTASRNSNNQSNADLYSIKL